MSRPAPWPRATTAQLSTELRLTARRGENLLAIAVIPVAVLVFFSTTTVLAVPGGTGVETLLPGAIALAIIASGLVNLGIATAYERSYGVLKRLGGSPLGRSGLVAAKVGSIAVIVTVQVIVLVVVAWAGLGWRPVDGASLPLTIGVVALGTATFAGLGLCLAGTLRAEAVLALANGLFLAAMLLGGIIVPTTALPGPIAAISDLLPAAALADGLRIALGASTDDLLRPLVVLLAWGAGSIAAAVRAFRWD